MACSAIGAAGACIIYTGRSLSKRGQVAKKLTKEAAIWAFQVSGLNLRKFLSINAATRLRIARGDRSMGATGMTRGKVEETATDLATGGAGSVRASPKSQSIGPDFLRATGEKWGQRDGVDCRTTDHSAAVGPTVHCRDKVVSLPELASVCNRVKGAGQTVVHAHGTFDLLHLGHARHLEAAHKLGDVLIVTVTADRFVNKGPGRPMFAAEMRAEMLANLEYVDWVAINDAADGVSAIEHVRPSVYVKGQDYRNPQGAIAGKIALEREAVESHGGRIHFTDEVTFSSTELINRAWGLPTVTKI
jgi:rfaE bifunctional protein nucleotidyltransferase chain/domain